VLVKKSDAALCGGAPRCYVVRTQPGENLDAGTFFEAHASLYPNGAERVAMRLQEADADGAGSGDIVIVFRDRVDEPLDWRYTSGGNIRSWHGGLNPSDSYVPFIVSYPGGNAQELAKHVTAVCGSAGRCEGNWQLTPLVAEIIGAQLPKEEQ